MSCPNNVTFGVMILYNHNLLFHPMIYQLDENKPHT